MSFRRLVLILMVGVIFFFGSLAVVLLVGFGKLQNVDSTLVGCALFVGLIMMVFAGSQLLSSGEKRRTKER